jgi:L-2-hydroxyglutarate oxidase
MIPSTADNADIAVVGGGIVGLATMLALRRAWPDAKLVLLEKEGQVALHQTGHNSGVIHSGIYYAPGSLKARLCVAGARRMVEFCAQNGVATQKIGKVIVATSPDELPRLHVLAQRARDNGVRASEIDARELRRIEPAAAGISQGVTALHSPDTQIVDYGQVARAMRAMLEAAGVRVRLFSRVTAITPRGRGLRIDTDAGAVNAGRLINCAGLHSDRVARLCGLDPGLRIVPFRGEYYMLKPASAGLVRGLIYPVPDPALPFLGVHFTRTIHGEVEAGPNAVLAFAREGYTMRDLSLDDLAHTLSFGGFWTMARKYWRTGAYEFYRSLSKGAFVRALRRLVPALRADDIARGGAGVRAQAVSDRGELLADFRFASTDNTLHVLNAPSPAATASLAIGDHIVDEARTQWSP